MQFTRDAYGPVMVLSCWAKGYQEPLYLVSNMDAAEEACRYYQKRFRIEIVQIPPDLVVKLQPLDIVEFTL